MTASNLTEVSARLSFHGQGFVTVARDAHTEIELGWCSAFGAMYRAYYASQTAHWNTKSRNFQQDHAMFQKQYEYWQETIDSVAEHIRTYDVELPERLSSLVDPVELDPMDGDDLGYVASYLTRLLQVLKILANISRKADDSEDFGSLDLAGGLIRDIRKSYWLLAQQLPEPDRTRCMEDLNSRELKLEAVQLKEAKQPDVDE